MPQPLFFNAKLFGGLDVGLTGKVEVGQTALGNCFWNCVCPGCILTSLALNQIKIVFGKGRIQDMRIRSLGKSGFTLIEIMIVVAIIGVLAAVAIPNLIKARKASAKQACIANLKAMEGAKAVWALENRKGDSDVPSDGDIFGADKTISRKPECPGGGTYDLRAVSEKPSCTVADHVLPN